jgi:hypothetical protein
LVEKEDTMKTRSMALLVMVGLILATGMGGAATTTLAGTDVSPNDHTHFGQVWNGSAAYGLLVQNFAASSIGLYGNVASSTGTTYGTIGRAVSPGGRGVLGIATSTTGTTIGTQGVSSSTAGFGVFGDSNYRGVYGLSRAGGGASAGTYGLSIASNGNGVLGIANSGSAAYGVWGSTTTGNGVVGTSTSSTGAGVLGTSNYRGVYGVSTGGGASSVGTYGQSGVANGTGVEGIASSGSAAFGVWGISSTGYAGYFSGNVRVIGTFSATGAKSFVIDHPLDPANKYLYHAAVESPDMKNVYDGVVSLDAKGSAWVNLPAWFESINKDFRYQLTSVGAPGPNLYVAQEIQGNRFMIAGGQPGAKISWQVTGIRNDPYAAQHRMQVEVAKTDQERGKYLYPQGYGQPDSMGMYTDKLNAATQPMSASDQKLATVGKALMLSQNSVAAQEMPAVPGQ